MVYTRQEKIDAFCEAEGFTGFDKDKKIQTQTQFLLMREAEINERLKTAKQIMNNIAVNFLVNSTAKVLITENEGEL